MKGKVLLSLLVIALAGTLIAGAMGAWFTDDADVPTAEFTAGTVKVNADGPEYSTVEGKSFENVNPGDCGRVAWTIINEGTKDAELRVKLEGIWDDEELPADNFYYAPAEGSGWVLYPDEDGLWLYYTGGPVPGTFSGVTEEERTVELLLVVAFHGEDTGDEYQGKQFRLGGIVEAVQASNDAPAEVWGEAFTTATAPGYEPEGLDEYLEYITGTKCWKGDEEPEPPEQDE